MASMSMQVKQSWSSSCVEDQNISWSDISQDRVSNYVETFIMKQPCNVLIYGGGAVGSIFGWRIAQSSRARVSVVCRSNYDAVKRNGFTFKTNVWGSGRWTPYAVYHSNDIDKAQTFDYIICANKVLPETTPKTLLDLREVVSAQTTLVSAQNGMDVELPLQQAFPHNPILSAICNIGCTQSSGQVEQRAGLLPHAFSIGTFNESSLGHNNDLIKRDALVALDTKFTSIEDVCQTRWRKLIFNSVWNATCAISDLNTHQAIQQPQTLQLARRLAHEACNIARRSGVNLDNGYEHSVIELARTSAAITASTLQDARNRKTMEVSSIWGYLVKRAAAYDLPVPFLNLVFNLLQHMNASFADERRPLMRSTSSLETTTLPLDLSYWINEGHPGRTRLGIAV